MEEYRSMQPVEVDIKRQQISVQLSTTVKAVKSGKKMGKSSMKEYKRIISGTNIMIDGDINGIWSTPRAKELKPSSDGGSYEYLGDKGKWVQFIKNNELITKFNWVPYVVC